MTVIKKIFEEVVKEIPSAMEYEEDAKYTWPERWELAQKRLEMQLNKVKNAPARCKKCFQLHHPKDYCYRVLNNIPEN